MAGAIAHRLGAPLTVALGGAVCIVGSLVFGSKWPALRGEARQLIVAQGMRGGEPPEEMNGQMDALGNRKTQRLSEALHAPRKKATIPGNFLHRPRHYRIERHCALTTVNYGALTADLKSSIRERGDADDDATNN